MFSVMATNSSCRRFRARICRWICRCWLRSLDSSGVSSSSVSPPAGSFRSMLLMGSTSCRDTRDASTMARTKASSIISATGCSACSTSIQTEYWVLDTRSTVPSASR